MMSLNYSAAEFLKIMMTLNFEKFEDGCDLIGPISPMAETDRQECLSYCVLIQGVNPLLSAHPLLETVLTP
jgi:hypothetical protein